MTDDALTAPISMPVSDMGGTGRWEVQTVEIGCAVRANHHTLRDNGSHIYLVPVYHVIGIEQNAQHSYDIDDHLKIRCDIANTVV